LTEAPDEDAALVAACLASGRVEDFEPLVHRHQHAVLRVAAAVLGPGHDRHAEDVAQDVFLQVFRRLATFERRSRFASWLYRITYNRALDYRRSLRAAPEAVLAFEPVAAVSGGADVLRAQALTDCISRLPDAQRTAIHLHYWLGHTGAEIAGMLGVQPGTVKAWLFRGRHLIARCLAAKGVRP
jgi:RNA polymerase sigma-70 factor (ECF subfamily)